MQSSSKERSIRYFSILAIHRDYSKIQSQGCYVQFEDSKSRMKLESESLFYSVILRSDDIDVSINSSLV